MSRIRCHHAIVVAVVLSGGEAVAARSDAPPLPPQAASCAFSGLCTQGRAAPRAGPLSEGWILPGRAADHAPPFVSGSDPGPSVVIAPLPPASVLMLGGLAVLALASLRRRRKS